MTTRRKPGSKKKEPPLYFPSKQPIAGGKGQFDALVVGGGSFGTALATLLTRNGLRVRLWVRRDDQAQEINRRHTNKDYFPGKILPPTLRATTDLRAAMQDVPAIIIAVPSRSFREMAHAIGDYVLGDQMLIHTAKGVEPETFKRMSEILREETCALKLGVISGPNLAEELMEGHPAGATVASHFDEVIAKAQELFAGSALRLYGAGDVVGAEIGGAFKNIVALVSGVAHGLGFGSNTKALIVTRGLSEMIRYGVALGAEAATFAGLAGIGDLMATCSSELSRNFRTGMRFARGEKLEDILGSSHQVVEGVPTTLAIHRQAGAMGLDLPMVRAVYSAFYEGKKLRDLLEELMERPTGRETMGV